MTRSSGEAKKTGNVKNRLQALNPVTGRYVKIDKETGRIIDQKKSPGPYKGIKILTKKNK